MAVCPVMTATRAAQIMLIGGDGHQEVAERSGVVLCGGRVKRGKNRPVCSGLRFFILTIG
jgi:hypothetical protein